MIHNVVTLLAHTPNPDRLIAQAARVCLAADRDATEREDTRLVRELVRLGHESVLEHASFTFLVEGISRTCSHQLVRHRIASYSQESQRYVDASKRAFIVPDSFGPFGEEIMAEICHAARLAYARLREAGVPDEDARMVLPQAVTTRIVVTMNARELRHFFYLRMNPAAQWEIRSVAARMFALVKPLSVAFRDGRLARYYRACVEEGLVE